jgi:hypothetical protein
MFKRNESKNQLWVEKFKKLLFNLFRIILSGEVKPAKQVKQEIQIKWTNTKTILFSKGLRQWPVC